MKCRCRMFLVLALPALCYAKVDRVEVIRAQISRRKSWGAVGAYRKSLRASILIGPENKHNAESLTSTTRTRTRMAKSSSRLIYISSAEGSKRGMERCYWKSQP